MKEIILTLEEHQNQRLEIAIDRTMMEMAKCFCDSNLWTIEDIEWRFRETPELIAERINFYLEIME